MQEHGARGEPCRWRWRGCPEPRFAFRLVKGSRIRSSYKLHSKVHQPRTVLPLFRFDKMQYLLLTAAAVGSLLSPASAATIKRSNALTSSGTLIGHPSSNKTHVTEFLGIRYAEAPVGELRFAAPKKYLAPSGTVFEASNWVGGRKIAKVFDMLTDLVTVCCVRKTCRSHHD